MHLSVATSGSTAVAVQEFVPTLVLDKVASRIAAKDFTLWGKDAESESSIRLGWVTSATDSLPLVNEILNLKAKLNSEGVTRFVLCGMGGSSLAPEVITKTAGVSLVVLDSTNPEQVVKALNGDLSKTAVIVSSKSGSTVETDSQKRLFEDAFTKAGIDKTARIVIVTDPGSPMEAAALADGYKVFKADATVGGRYSALTAFGLVPSGLAGANIEELLHDAAAAASLLEADRADNPGLVLGAALAKTIQAGEYADKIVILEDGTHIKGFGDWAEQLIAESTGKIGKGILPVVVTKSANELKANANDQLVVRVVAEATNCQENEVAVSGSLGAQFLLWEYATVVASRLIGINPFDQPDVESAKIAARGMLESRSPELEPNFIDSGVEVRAQGFELSDSKTISGAIRTLLSQIDDDGYLSVHAYLDREGVPEAAELRDLLAAATSRPTTFGWAPRFLHSTGQYHKGGPTQGVYLQIISRAADDLAVPGRDFTLGELIASQASGDAKVLADHGRPVLTLTLSNVKAGLKLISESI